MSGWAPLPVVAAPPTFPVIETFGPVIQGEGVLAGVPTHFVRFGGCDYRCSWCDSMYAVDPVQVKTNAVKLSTQEVLARVTALPSGPQWVTLSGGNPALLELGALVERLHEAGYLVAVETQGSRWRDWLGDLDCLTVSPKPPSSGMAAKTDRDLARFMNNYPHPLAMDALKIVVFNDADYEWARDVFSLYAHWPRFLSVGTDPVGEWGSEVVSAISYRDTLERVGRRYAWLTGKAAGDPEMRHVRILPQLHVMAFGHARGV